MNLKKQFLGITLASIAMTSSYAVTTSVQSNATLQGTCVLSASDFNFPTLTPGQTNVSLTKTFTSLCSNGVNYTLGFEFPNSDDTYMTGSQYADKLYYYLYNNNTAKRVTPTQSTISSGKFSTGVVSSFPLLIIIMGDSSGSNFKVPYTTPDNYSATVKFTITY